MKIISHALLLLLSCMLLGCGVRSGTTSLRYLNHAPLGPAVAPGLVVMLPGLGDRATHFEKHGFVDTARSHGGWDVIVADAHFGYYRIGEVVHRLRQDIIGPARALGYRNIWLVGVSMGGFGATSYAAQYPEDVQGLILISPYLGSHEGDMSAIKSAQVNEKTRRRAADSPPAALERRVWNLLAEKASNGEDDLFLTYGSDENDAAHLRLAKMLEPKNVHVEPGGHKWHVWRPAFNELSKRALRNQKAGNQKGSVQ